MKPQNRSQVLELKKTAKTTRTMGAKMTTKAKITKTKMTRGGKKMQDDEGEDDEGEDDALRLTRNGACVCSIIHVTAYYARMHLFRFLFREIVQL